MFFPKYHQDDRIKEDEMEDNVGRVRERKEIQSFELGKPELLGRFRLILEDNIKT
jgi:hypothetical protein